MHTTETLVIGGGQAGLAVSSCLTALGRDHLVLERGRVGERWRSERWDSLRLLSPNWMTRLPGWRYAGPDQDGFLTATEFASFLDGYAASFAAPIQDGTSVRRVARQGDRFVVTTDQGPFRSRNVVIATGWCDRPAVPAAARLLDARIHQVTPDRYRRPDDLPDGGVLVVGASATGVQLAHELQASGRPVTLAVGSHRRMPRRYRGMDSFWWLDLLGTFNRTVDDFADEQALLAARREPSVQLVGRPDHATLDLATLTAAGVRLVGRVTGIDGTRVAFGADLPALLADADLHLANVLARIDRAVDRCGLGAEVDGAEPIATVPTPAPLSELDLRAAGITTVLWATGHRRAYDWLDLPILGRTGEIVQYRGVTAVPGAYVLGLRFQHHRNSNFIDGVGRDAQFVAAHLCRTRRPGGSPALLNERN